MARRQYGAAPSNAADLATKAYVDARVPFSGPAFSAKRITTDQTLTDNVAAEVVFNGEDSDTAAAYNPATGRFTPQTAGLYQINARLVFTSSAADILAAQLYVYKNGALHRATFAYFGSGASTVVGVASCTVQLNGSSDYVSIFGIIDTTAGTPKIGQNSFFEGFYCGEPNLQAVNVQSVTSAATVTPTFLNDAVKITAQAAGLTLANPTGTPIDNWGISIRIKDNGTARAISYGTQYRGMGVTLPTTTVAGKTLYLGMIYNVEDTKWDVVSVVPE